MLRKLSLAFLALALTFAGTLPTNADAQGLIAPRTTQHHPHSSYTVLYRHDHHHAWRVYGQYSSHHDADHAANHLRGQGYEVRVDQSF